MSRIGKRPIALPKGVTVTLKNGTVDVKGPKGSLTHPFSSLLTFEQKDAELNIGMKSDADPDDANRAHGTARAHIANAVKGVSDGFKVKLLLLGTGYKAELKGDVLNLSLGLSHPVNYKLPKEVKVTKIEPKGTMIVSSKNETGAVLELESFSKDHLGQTVAKLQSFRPPEPYKGKGVNVEGQKIIRKAGKAGGKGGK